MGSKNLKTVVNNSAVSAAEKSKKVAPSYEGGEIITSIAPWTSIIVDTVTPTHGPSSENNQVLVVRT